jgi:hypothetical protein
VTRLSGHAYPWDVLGDPEFPCRVRDHGVSDITLACAYHAVRAATPLHPRHQIITAPTSALYRPVRRKAWSGHRLVPAPASWLDDPAPFDTATTMLGRAGFKVSAWVVLTHNSRLGESYPDVAVTNCFGDRYPHALCPQWSEVRRYAATLASESVQGIDLSGVLLEAWGQHGVAHGGMHDKTAGAWSPATSRLLSICCCAACQTTWIARGLDPGQVIADLRTAVWHQHNPAPEMVEQIRAARLDGTAALLAEVLDAIADTAPGMPVTVFADPDPWSAIPVSAVDTRVATVLVSAWATEPGRADAVSAARLALPAAVTVGAYVTVLPPVEPPMVPTHVRRLLTAGAQQLNLYHLGLAGPDRQRALGTAVLATRGETARQCQR